MNIIKKLKENKKLWRILLMALSLLLSATLYNIFLLPLNLVTGGTQGIAIITKHLYKIDPALMIFILSGLCAIFSFIFVGIGRTAGTIVASILYPLLVKITSPLATFIAIDSSDMLLLVIFAGAISGLANGLMYKTGFSNGGFPVVSQVLYEKKQISISDLESLSFFVSSVLSKDESLSLFRDIVKEITNLFPKIEEYLQDTFPIFKELYQKIYRKQK